MDEQPLPQQVLEKKHFLMELLSRCKHCKVLVIVGAVVLLGGLSFLHFFVRSFSEFTEVIRETPNGSVVVVTPLDHETLAVTQRS
jgi:uncharacterized membrane protein